jgi:hypothetical protein
MEILPEKYRGLGISIKRWDIKRRTETLFAEPSAMPALYNYFHVVDPAKTYLTKESAAKALGIRTPDRNFTVTWAALERAAIHAADGEDIRLGEKLINAAILRQGIRPIPQLEKSSLEDFRTCMEQEVGFTESFPPGGPRGGRSR